MKLLGRPWERSSYMTVTALCCYTMHTAYWANVAVQWKLFTQAGWSPYIWSLFFRAHTFNSAINWPNICGPLKRAVLYYTIYYKGSCRIKDEACSGDMTRERGLTLKNGSLWRRRNFLPFFELKGRRAELLPEWTDVTMYSQLIFSDYLRFFSNITP